MKKISILGIRGVPASHGGFETFAEQLALYLVNKGWEVVVYCQSDGGKQKEVSRDIWNGVSRVHVPVRRDGALGTVEFDYKSTSLAARDRNSLILTLGYNTAVFCVWYRIFGVKNIINMDGVEWRRDKWRAHEKVWLWINEIAGCVLGNHLIADHPEIKRHLGRRISEAKITMIPYGGREVISSDLSLLKPLGLDSARFLSVIARPEPENSVYEIVKAFSERPRGAKLAVLGGYRPAEVEYHRKVMECASDEVLFVGAIYDKDILDAIRLHSEAYIHGHTVGGTNPSLVEALAAGSAIVAHDNRFNRWVAGDGGLYFDSVESCSTGIDFILNDSVRRERLARASRARFQEQFTWGKVLGEYEDLLSKYVV